MSHDADVGQEAAEYLDRLARAIARKAYEEGTALSQEAERVRSCDAAVRRFGEALERSGATAEKTAEILRDFRDLPDMDPEEVGS